MLPGVFNVVHGYGPASAGQALTENPAVDRITFTGESTTGRIIAAAGARNLTPVSLELGGKGANLVFAATEAEAVGLANDTPYGLNAMLFTENLHRAHRVAAALRGGHGLGQLLPRARPDGAVRRHGHLRDRPRGR